MAGKSKSKSTPVESCLILPHHPSTSTSTSTTSPPELIDTHTHVLSTYQTYLSKYPEAQHTTIKDFVRALLLTDKSNRVDALVDVWCEAPVLNDFESVVSSLAELRQEGLRYHYVVGAHPHEAQSYIPEIEASFIKAYQNPYCVGFGEIGLDYHYDNSPREVQRDVLRRQLNVALETDPNKAITIHTREADEDIISILTTELPKSQKLHIHCFTDAPETAQTLMDHFPNCFIGITGVISYASNLNTAQVIRNMASVSSPSSTENLRILLETDAPYMIPSTLGPPSSLGMKSSQKMPFSHSGMLPWTAEFVARILNENKAEDDEGRWLTEDVLRVARENARKVYGI